MRADFVVLAICVVAGCGPDSSIPQRPPADVPTQEIQDFSFTETRGGVARWTLYGTTLRDFPSGDVLVGGVHVDFFEPRGESLLVTSTLRADSGHVRRSTQDIRVWGNVVVDNREGTRLLTGWLGWRQRTETISTRDTVLVIRGTDTMRGRGMESDPQLGNVRILEEVTGTLRGRTEAQ